MTTCPDAPPAAWSLLTRYEQSLPAESRRRDGVHYTPPEVAASVLELAFSALGRIPAVLCDPTCGGGAFLLSAADRLLASGVPADQIVRHRLVGVELDGGAVAVARACLSRWADHHGARVGVDEVQVHQRDALVTTAEEWPARPRGGFDLVIGNPPFLNQLSRRTARSARRRDQVTARFGQVGPYTDDAGLFLLAATDLAAPDGVVAMVQPQSLLSARDAAAIRRQLLERAQLVALWAHGGTPFADAEVHVCAPVLRLRAAGGERPDRVTVLWQHHDQEHRDECPAPHDDQRWGGLLGPAHGVPATPSLAGAALGEVATATAGFRDEFYALCGALVPGRPSGDRAGAADPRLVTVGMIDPLTSRWGTTEHRIGGRSVLAPRVDLSVLDQEAPRVAGWVRDRLVPKVLVATQTKVVEAVADPEGSCVPMTPTISVEPIAGRLDVWHLVAALSAPPVAAYAVREHLGAGRSAGALRWSARAVLDTPMPLDVESWNRGAELARLLHRDPARPVSAPGDPGDRVALLGEFGVAMTVAYGLEPDHPVVNWWSVRLPRR